MDYVIAGATGLVGTEVVRQLLTDETAQMFCLGRRAPDLTGPRLHFVPWSFSGAIDWKGATPANVHAICTLGTTIKVAGSQEAFRRVDLEYVLSFARSMEKLGAQSFHVVTAHGASAASTIFYNRVKGETEDLLQQVGLRSLHIYRPSLLLGHRKEHRPGEGFATSIAQALAPVFKLPGLNRVQPTPADRLATAIVANCRNATSGVHVHSNYEIMSK